MSDDRRNAIEEAFAELEKNEGNPQSTEASSTPEVPAEASPKIEEVTPAEPTSAPIEGEDRPEATGTTPEVKPIEVNPGYTAPVAWKEPLKAKWGSLEPEIQAEISRRETETSRALNDSAQARNFAKQFGEAVAPFAPRLQAMQAHPIQAVRNLLAADHLLATGSKMQRAQAIAKFIKDYDVDVATLDEVLAGAVSPQARAEEAQLQRFRQELDPIKQKLSAYEQREQQMQQAQAREMESQIEKMATDAKFPYFNEVRDAMADLIEINARRGITLDLPTAYNRAVAADSNLRARLDLEMQQEAAKQAAQRAQQAKQASASVRGSPAGGAKATVPPSDRRAIIAAAFEVHGG